ncbi:MAG: type II secretion system F family protein [Gammaproteobacteria bacterium]|nr:type II secretion system F family protein [Gammaproteobacteria bacterium]
MPNFIYKGRNLSGHPVEGIINADNKDQVASQLINNGVTPIDITQQTMTTQPDILKNLLAKMNEKEPGTDELILFSRQSYSLLKSGLPIVRAFKGLAELATNPVFAKSLNGVVDGLESGRPLSSAMSTYPKTFPAIFVNMIKVGEETGNLDEAFNQLSEYLQREKDTMNRIKDALRYPSMVFIAIFAALFIINIFVIPTFSDIFKAFDSELPLPTQILITISNFTLNFWPYILLGITLLFFSVRRYINSKQGRYQWDYYKLRLPIVGSIILRATLSRLMRAFSMAMSSGVPILQALNTIALSADNDYIAAKMRYIREGIERGDSLTRSATAANIFTPLVLQMMAVGEESGTVDQLMLEVADFYDREVDYELKGLSAAIEPILIVFIGGLVLMLALGIFLPMWDLGSAAMNH